MEQQFASLTDPALREERNSLQTRLIMYVGEAEYEPLLSAEPHQGLHSKFMTLIVILLQYSRLMTPRIAS
jgi:hypothetical protein